MFSLIINNDIREEICMKLVNMTNLIGLRNLIGYLSTLNLLETEGA